MADRTVKVTLVANATGYVQGMALAAQKTRELGTEAEKLAAKRQAFTAVGAGMLAIGVAASLGVGVAVSKFMQFDAAMSQVNAVTQETLANQLLLRDAALEAGGATVYTATEAANAEEELAKAGLRTADILGGALYGSLNLAASGQLEVARSAEITGITLKQFSLDGSQAARVADVLSAGANKAVGSVEDLAQGLKFVGPVTAGMNVSLEDTVATLALFADQGILGEQAGTSLRGMLSSLTSPSKQARDELDRLGVSLYDGNGRFLGMENAAGQLHGTLAGVSDAERDLSLGIIFGNQQVTAARVLVAQGAEKWREYRAAVSDTGIAQRIASERMDNLSGDVEKLGGAFDTALIRTGSGANGVLRDMVQTATFLVDVVGGLPEPVLAAGLALGVAAAAVGLVGGAALLAVPKIADFRAGLASLNTTLGVVSLKAGLVAGALALATFAIGAGIQKAAEYKASVDQLADSFDKVSGAATNYTRDIQKKALEDSGAYKNAQQLGISLDLVTEAALGNAEALAEVKKQGKDAWESSSDFFDRYGKGVALGNLTTNLDLLNGQLSDAQGSWQRMSEAGGQSEDTLDGVASSAAVARDEINKVADAVRGFGSGTLDAREAHRALHTAIIDANKALAENGATLDITTEAGNRNQETLDGIAKRTLEYAASVLEQTGSQEQASAAMQAGRDALLGMLAQYGITGDAAIAYVDDLGLIPDQVVTTVDLYTDGALTQLDEFVTLASGRIIHVPMVLTLQGRENYIQQQQMLDYFTPQNFAGGLYESGVKAFAAGGFGSGIYSDRKGPLYKFAEPGVGWEAFISGAPAYRQQNIGYAYEALDRLGALPASFPPPASFVAPVTGGGGDSGVMQELVAGVVAAIREHPTVVEIDGRPVVAAVREFNRSTK